MNFKYGRGWDRARCIRNRLTDIYGNDKWFKDSIKSNRKKELKLIKRGLKIKSLQQEVCVDYLDNSPIEEVLNEQKM